MTLKIEITAPAASNVPGQVDPVTFSRIAARPASWPSNSVYGCAATATSEIKTYRRGHNNQRDHDRNRQVAVRVLDFLAGGRDGI